jgi:hypothetical protein
MNKDEITISGGNKFLIFVKIVTSAILGLILLFVGVFLIAEEKEYEDAFEIFLIGIPLIIFGISYLYTHKKCYIILNYQGISARWADPKDYTNMNSASDFFLEFIEKPYYNEINFSWDQVRSVELVQNSLKLTLKNLAIKNVPINKLLFSQRQ